MLAADAELRLPNDAVAARMGTSHYGIVTWLDRFLTHRLDGVADAHRSGTPQRVVGDSAVGAIIMWVLEYQPEGATHYRCLTGITSSHQALQRLALPIRQHHPCRS